MRIVLSLVVAFAALTPAASGSVSNIGIAPPEDGFTRYGHAIAVDGEIFVVGAYRTNIEGKESAGAVYVYTCNRKGFDRQPAILTASDSERGDSFGEKVAIDGNRIVVGASDKQEDGAAYIFTLNSQSSKWNEYRLPTPEDAAYFGSDVAISGDTIFVGASTQIGGGAVYIYKWNGTDWQESILLASNRVSNSRFGASLAIHNNTLLIGANRAPQNSIATGAVYIFKRSKSNKWFEEHILHASDGAQSDNFGDDVAVYEDTLVVGAPDKDNCEGAAYVYTWNSKHSKWIEKKLLPKYEGKYNRYGIAVAVDDQNIAIAATSAGNGGEIYLHRRNLSGKKEMSICHKDDAYSTYFGMDMALQDGRLYIGASGEASRNGGAYICYLKKPSRSLYTMASNRIRNIAPPRIRALKPKTAKDGKRVIFKVQASGKGPFKYRWQISARPMPDKSTSTDDDCEWRTISKAKKSSYMLNPALYDEDNGYHFRCVVTNKGGGSTSNGARLLVTQK